MKQVLSAFRSARSGSPLRGKINLYLVTASVLFLAGCDPGIDFNKHGKDRRERPEQLDITTGIPQTTLNLMGCGRTVTYRFTDVSAMMGVLNLHTSRDPAAPESEHCELVAKIVLKKDGSPLSNRDTITRTIIAGESMTDVMDVLKVNNIEVILTCVGENSSCIFADPVFTSGKKATTPNRRQTIVAPNATPQRTYTTTNANDKCNTGGTVLHKLYLDYDPALVGLEFVAVSKCDCANFIVTLQNRGDVESRASQNSAGNTATVEAFGGNEKEISFIGTCAGSQNDQCAGDVELRISGKSL